MLAISADSLASHEKFAAKLGGLPFPHLSDRDLDAIRAYGVLNDKGTGPRRSVFVVDREGILRYVNTKFGAGNPQHYEEVLKALTSLG